MAFAGSNFFGTGSNQEPSADIAISPGSKKHCEIGFAYAHNAYASPNVEKELQAVSSMVSSLPSCQGVQIEVAELGLEKIEALYLASSGTIQVTEELDLKSRDIIGFQSGQGWTAYVLSLNGQVLHDLYERHDKALFSANLRDFLGTRRNVGNVNSKIQKTAESRPGDFFIFNNGITIITKKADLYNDKNELHIYGISIVNGAQTTGAIHAAGKVQASKVSVLARVITVADKEKIVDIVAGNNTQNAILAWDRRSSDPVQVRLAREFSVKGVEYVHRRDSSMSAKSALFAEQSGQSICSFNGDLQTAIRAKADIFESDETYNRVFPQSLTIGHVYAVQGLARAYDETKSNLKAKVNSDSATAIEGKQFQLLDYAASKQFMIYICGSLREEIAGFRVVDAHSFEIRPDKITENGVEVTRAWTKVLRSLLPIVVQSLTTEEYKAVRSTEYAKDTIQKVKGIVAGVEALQASFEDLRKCLFRAPQNKLKSNSSGSKSR